MPKSIMQTGGNWFSEQRYVCQGIKYFLLITEKTYFNKNNKFENTYTHIPVIFDHYLNAKKL